MAVINRSLIVVKPKKPFLDWLNSVEPDDDDLQLEDINDDPTAYLVPQIIMEGEQEGIIDWCADFVFEQELWSWYTDEDLWPVGRNAAMFREWFDVESHSMVNDVVGDIPLEHIDYEESDEVDPSSNGH
jgi:hypothetical protein